MIAWKFLRPGAVGPFSGFTWPTPADGQPGPWVDSAGAPAECVAGIHACAVDHLPIWLDAELWVVELDGHVVRGATKLVAPRGRLMSRVAAWSADTAGEFGKACADRAQAHARSVLREAGPGARADRAAGAGPEELPGDHARSDRHVRKPFISVSRAAGLRSS